ncbi:hypothetical protein VU06_02800, partial [Desulfobulbus sp. F3]|nr:hypothetical protein [Desulfobulbus sp. F3]
AIHPLHVESVAWVSERKDLLSAFLFLLTLLSYVEYINHEKYYQYILSVLFFSLSLMSKPMAVTLPFILLLLDYWPLGRIHAGYSSRAILGILVEKIPFMIMTFLSCAMTLIAQSNAGAVRGADEYPVIVRISNALISYVIYIKKMFVPSNLGILYPYPNVTPVSHIIVAFVILSCITFFSMRYRKKFRWFFVGWFWYIGTLVPVIGFLQVGNQAYADRYTYIPSIGILMIISYGMDLNCKKMRKKNLFLLLITAKIQTSHWKNGITLFEHTLKVTRNNYNYL